MKFKTISTSSQANIFLYSKGRYNHAGVVVDGEDQIIIIGGPDGSFFSSGSSKTGEIVKSK